jgi:multisubunit Na+/H+ antiporter MnhB subunit
MEGTVSGLLTGLDVVLAGMLVGFAAVLLATPNLFKSIVLFIVFGLLMAITWARLGAIDVAIAEAAIGAGLTGALFLNARGDLEAMHRRRQRERRAAAGARVDALPAEPRRWAPWLATTVAVVPMLLILAWSMLAAPADLEGMGPTAFAALDESGARNPVTAVLLNFRAYDTVLEITVLLLAVVAAWSQRLGAFPEPDRPPGPILQAAVRLLAPPAVLIGGYLLWRGTHAPGGAFQAGAVLAGAGVLVLLGERWLPRRGRRGALRLGLAVGVLVFLVAGLAGLILDGHFLFYRGARAEAWIVAIEVAATVSIALALIGLFAGRPPAPRGDA